MSATVWSAGRYESVAERISGIARQVVETAARRRELTGAAVVDLACGTGSAAVAAAGHGARVTGVDLTPELLDQARQKQVGDITWVAADASATGLPEASYDVALSNMGIIFVEPAGQVAELARLLKPAGVLAFSSWVRDQRNPFFDPIVATLGQPPASGFSPDQWGDHAVASQRLDARFTAIEFERGALTWTFDSLDAAMHFLEYESPMHVGVFGRLDDALRDRLRAAFRAALEPHAGDGPVAFDAPYVVISAIRT